MQELALCLMRHTSRIQRLSLLMLCITAATTNANATMPPLTPKPQPITQAACAKWASEQDDDALDMWGNQAD